MYEIRKTYTDFNDIERTETFRFHFNEVELMEMQASADGGLEVMVQRIIDAQDSKEIIQIMKNMVLKAYGKKSDNGKNFIKNDEIRAEFESSPAFPMIFMELATDDEKAAEFFNNVVPKKLRAEAEKAIAESKKELTAVG